MLIRVTRVDKVRFCYGVAAGVAETTIGDIGPNRLKWGT
jgi:hypothetical protein